MEDAFSRFGLQVNARDSCPTSRLREKFRRRVAAKCSKMVMDMAAPDERSNAWRNSFQRPSNFAFEGELPLGKLRRRPPVDMVDLVIGHLLCSRVSRWEGIAFSLVSGMRRRRPSEARNFVEVLRFPKNT